MFHWLRKFIAVALPMAMMAGSLVSSVRASYPPRSPAFSKTKKLRTYKEVENQGKELGCKWSWMLSPQSYWFKQAQYEVKGTLYKDIIQSTRKKGLCYFFYWDQFFVGFGYRYYPDLAWEDVVHTFGYLDYIEKVIHEEDLGSTPKGWPKGKTVRMRLKDITGVTFQNKLKLIVWFKEYERYLFWSKPHNRLHYDPERKENKNPYPKRTFGEYWRDEPLYIKIFWSIKTRGWVLSEWKTSKFIKGTYHSIYQRRLDLRQFKIKRSLLKKHIKLKKEVYLEFLQELIQKLDNPEQFSLIPEKNNYYAIDRLQFLTDQTFETKKEWIEWYEKNKGHLRLSEDGEKIVAQ